MVGCADVVGRSEAVGLLVYVTPGLELVETNRLELAVALSGTREFESLVVEDIDLLVLTKPPGGVEPRGNPEMPFVFAVEVVMRVGLLNPVEVATLEVRRRFD